MYRICFKPLFLHSIIIVHLFDHLLLFVLYFLLSPTYIFIIVWIKSITKLCTCIQLLHESRTPSNHFINNKCCLFSHLNLLANLTSWIILSYLELFIQKLSRFIKIQTISSILKIIWPNSQCVNQILNHLKLFL